MPLLLRHLLIQLLLLAVFFNTVIGLPAHEAEHLEQSTVAVTVPSAQPAAEHADDPEHDSEVHGACAWCLAFAHPGIAPAWMPVVHAWAVQAGLPQTQNPVTFVPGPGRWPFASRDPPHATA